MRDRAERLFARLWPDSKVTRTVQGVTLTLPRSHMLPTYARHFPDYGQNLVRVAEVLSSFGALSVADIGANIGDSAAQILARVPNAKLWCIEGDAYWMPFLRTNLQKNDGVEIFECLLTSGQGGPVTGIRHHGTTQFIESPGEQVRHDREMTVADLIEVTSAAENLLIKSDTDGWDVKLIGEIAQKAKNAPHLFFEFDPGLTRKVGNGDAHEVWPCLANAGFSKCIIWGNRGDLVTICTTDAAAELWHTLGMPSRQSQYWDVLALPDEKSHAVLAALNSAIIQ